MIRARHKINKELTAKIVPILKRHGIKKAGIFGSYAREDYNKRSDVDILIEFNGSLLTLVGIELELKKSLKRNVDLLTYRGINHLLKKRILKEEIQIL